MKLKILAFCMMAMSLTGMAGSGDKGNGQLVVVPTGAKAPVPYEVAKSWESGVYRNFSKLPGINGNIERRERFNRNYAVHAQAWMNILKEYSPKIHKDLEEAGKATMFRFLSNYILWKHEDYPEGEVDYKTFEKAAFFNGEIIISTMVMDRMGGIGGVISKQENQGFVLIHELINAAYPSMPIKKKLRLGELIANIKLLRWSKTEFNAELILENADENYSMVRGLKPNELIDALNDIGDLAIYNKFSIGLELLTKAIEIFSKGNTLVEPDHATVELFESLSGNGDRRLVELMDTLKALKNLGMIQSEEIYTTVLDYIDLNSNISWSSYRESFIREYLKEKRARVLENAFDSYNRKLEGNDYEGFENFNSLYNLSNSLLSNVQSLSVKKFKHYLDFSQTYSNTLFRSEVQSLRRFRALENKVKAKLESQMIALKISKYYRVIPYLTDSRDVFNVSQGQTYRYITDSSSVCNFGSTGLNYEESYEYTNYSSKKFVFTVVSSNKPERVGQKLRLDRIPTTCSHVILKK